LPSLIFRTPWPAGAEESGAAADEDHRQSAGPCHLQCRGPEETALLQPPVGQVARTAIPERPGTAADLLSEAGGSCAGASSHREHVRHHIALLRAIKRIIITLLP